MRAIATSLHHPEVAYVSYDHLSLDGKNWIGVAKTTNSGGEWKLVWKEADTAAQEYSRCLDHRALRAGMGRESAGHDGRRSGSQSRVWHRSRPHHAHQLTAGLPGLHSIPAK